MNTTAPRLGIYHDLPAEDYHADPGSVSNTMLSSLDKSPAHCYALHLDHTRPPSVQTEAMRLGSLTHCFVLEPTAVFDRYVLKPESIDYRTKDGKAWRDAQTKEIVTADELVAVSNQAAAVSKVGKLREMLKVGGKAETSIFWRDKTTGLRCRARPDWLQYVAPKRVRVLDLKTIAELTPEAVQRAIATYGYHRQEAHYTAGLEACGLTVEEFVFGFVSKSYPYLAAAFVLDDESKQQGLDEVATLLGRFAECQARNEWPAFGDGPQLTGLPAWARSSQEIEVEWA